MTGAWSAGVRIEAARLADEIGVSITPVRDALNRLAGERLVDFIAGEGFRVPLYSEAELRDLFGLYILLLLAAVVKAGIPRDANQNMGDIAHRSSRLFLRLACSSETGEFVPSSGARSDRITSDRNRVGWGTDVS